MRIERVVTFPGMWFFGKCVFPEKAEWRVVLNKRELATLKRANEILDEWRALAAGDDEHGPDLLYDEVDGGDELTMASVYLHEVVTSEPSIALTDAALSKIGGAA